MTSLNERERQVREAVISTYVETAEPAGSRTVAKRLGMALSPRLFRLASRLRGSLAGDGDRREVADEGAMVSEPGHLAEEDELPGTMEFEQPGQEQSPEQRAQHPHRQHRRDPVTKTKPPRGRSPPGVESNRSACYSPSSTTWRAVCTLPAVRRAK